MRIAATAYGRRVALDVAPTDLDVLRALLPWWWRDDDPEADADTLLVVPDAGSAREVVAALELEVAEHAVDRVFVHAAVVACGDRALLLPGPSFAGKSTLAAALLDTGLGYLSDEYAVLDAAGSVYAYPRPLTTRTDAGRNHRVVEHVDGPLQVAAVALLQYATGAEYAVTPTTPGDAVLGVLANTVCASTRPAEALQAVTTAVAGAGAVTGHRGEARAAALHLRELLR